MALMCTYIFRVTDAETGEELGTLDTFAYRDDERGAEIEVRRKAQEAWGDRSYNLELIEVRAGMDI